MEKKRAKNIDHFETAHVLIEGKVKGSHFDP